MGVLFAHTSPLGVMCALLLVTSGVLQLTFSTETPLFSPDLNHFAQ
jgi:hypothetical protein